MRRGSRCCGAWCATGRVGVCWGGRRPRTADAVYGSVAAFGLTAISAVLTGGRSGRGLAGGLFLCSLGTRTRRAIPVAGSPPAGRRGVLGSYGSTLLLTLTNPMTILSFAAIFAGLGITARAGYASALALVAGVFSCSALWWRILSGVAGAVRPGPSAPGRPWVDCGSGGVFPGLWAPGALAGARMRASG